MAMPEQSAPLPREPWWPFILAGILSCIIVVLCVVSYMSYQHNVELSFENSSLATDITSTSDALDRATKENADLSKKVAQLSCVGTWTGDTCVAPPVGTTTATTSKKR
jgi:hypothetical protein